MEPKDFIRSKIAKALLNQHDVRKRNRQIWAYVIALLALFVAHGYFTNMTTELKLIPQTMTAMGMGYLLLCINSLRRFGWIADFIDWEKVRESADGAPR